MKEPIYKKNHFLEGKKVYLRSFEKDDGSYLKIWLNNKKINYYLEMGYRPYREKEVKEFTKMALESDSAIVFSILEKKKSKPIGTCGLYNLDFISKRGQLNIIIGNEEYINDGYGKDSVNTLIKYGFERIGLNSIQLGVNAENLRAIKSYKNAGFKVEGKRRQFIYCNNQFNDMIFMSILAAEYKKK